MQNRIYLINRTEKMDYRSRSHTIFLGAGDGAGATKIQVAPHPCLKS